MWYSYNKKQDQIWMYTLEFQAACSAAGSELGDYTKQVRCAPPQGEEEALTSAICQGSLQLRQLLALSVVGGHAEVVVLLQRDARSAHDAHFGVPSRLLSSRLGTRGLHPVGALTRPHRRN